MCKNYKKANKWGSMVVSIGEIYLGGSRVERTRKRRVGGIIENM